MTTIIQKAEAWLLSETARFLPRSMQAAVALALTDEGIILDGLIGLAVTDVMKNGITTAGMVETAKDVFAQLVAQNIEKFSLQHVFGYLNLGVANAQNTPTA